MRKNIKLIMGVVILVVIIAGAYFALGSGGFSVTGAFTGPKECIGSGEKSFYNACSQWKDNGYKDRPSTLKVLTEKSARQTCDKLLREYTSC